MYRRTMGVLAALAVGWAPMAAGATTLTNASKEKAKVSIEKWIRFIDGESTVEFLPVELPATIYVQFPMASLDCDIPSRESEVRISEEGCWVDGELVSQAQFRF